MSKARKALEHLASAADATKTREAKKISPPSTATRHIAKVQEYEEIITKALDRLDELEEKNKQDMITKSSAGNLIGELKAQVADLEECMNTKYWEGIRDENAKLRERLAKETKED